MLKRFLQLFRNEDVPSGEVDHPHCGELEGQSEESTTYLEFLFSSVRPRVRRRIEDHPNTDPVLEIATGILMELFPDYWEEPTGALTDDWSPQTEVAPPPPPVAGAGAQTPPAPPPATERSVEEAPPAVDESSAAGDEEDEGSLDEETVDDSEFEVIDDADKSEVDETEDVEDDSVEVEVIDEAEDGEEAGDNKAEDAEDADEVDEGAEADEVDVDEEGHGEDEGEASDDDSDVDGEGDVGPGEEAQSDDNTEDVAEKSETSDADNGEEDVLEVDGDEVVEVEEEFDDDAVHEVDDLDAVEEEIADADAAPPAGFVSALDDTAEFEPPPVRRGVEEPSIWPVALDDPSVLRGARVLLAVLIDNDRLPVDEQLEVAEFLMAADLWVHLMVQATDLDERAQNLARLVEQKFETNHFSQARLLLELFPANRDTRIKHDRQLFYEDMILRLGVRRAHPDAIDRSSLEAGFDTLELSDDDELVRAFESLADEAKIRMHVYTREPSEVEGWRELAELCQWSDAVPYLLSKLPPRRWRASYLQRERSMSTVLQEHIVVPMARDHVIAHIKACYFVLRAVGDTGLEPYLDCFFDWSESFCGVDATTYLAELHQRVQRNDTMIDEVFTDIYDRYYRAPIAEALERLDDDVLEASFAEAMEHLSGADLAQVAGGNYDLGAFVLDSFLAIEHPSPEFSFKLHRLT